jgi:hypothetical protein
MPAWSVVCNHSPFLCVSGLIVVTDSLPPLPLGIRVPHTQSTIFPVLDTEFERLRPSAVTVCGLSLGASVSQLVGLYVANKYGQTLSRKVRGLWATCVLFLAGQRGHTL